MPLFSIITPVYNAARWLPGLVASVQAQTHADWEWICVDDASTDASASILAETAAADPRIRLIRLPQNVGPAGARQSGYAEAKGRAIAFLDADDLWLPQKLARQWAFMEARAAALCHTAYRRFRSDSGHSGPLILPPTALSYHQLLGNTAIALSSAMVDRVKTGPLNFVDHPVEDFILWLAILRSGHKALGLPEDLMRYRVHAHSWSSRPQRNAARVWQIYREIERLPLTTAVPAFLSYAAHALLRRMQVGA